ncbi:site-specific integrase [Burkholderia vietnamiensis]|uniref:site-specific integrase n=1 Tax=Burkholderia vietnamiensis TaxID=60552 RepID=UPI000AB4004B|nr:site-specific integrase [Burkholderia vietnamiensis]
MNGFIAAFGHTSTSAQRQSFNCVRKFASFLRATGAATELPLPASVAFDLRDWLETAGLAASTSQSILNVSLSILDYCERNAPHLLSRGTRLTVERFASEPPKLRPVLSENTLKAILTCCYKEIESVEQKLSMGRRLLAGVVATEAEAVQAQVISELLRLGHGSMPSKNMLSHSLRHRVALLGGMRGISRSIWLCPRDLLPFYLALLIQTSGNPDSIFNINRNCLVPHPLRDDLERVVWTKPRAHREQHIEAPVGRPWSAPNIVRRLIVVNENLIEKCDEREKRSLFIAYRCTQKSPAVPTISLIHLMLKEFIKSNSLPEFTFSSVRRAGATAHYRATGSAQAAKKRLNHESISTTARYIDSDLRRDRHDLVIRRFQGLIVQASLAPASESRLSKPSLSSTPNKITETVFGFQCRDPFSGVAEGSSPGNLCLQFQKCATCPGALIPLDNVAVVAKLLAAHSALEEAHMRALNEGWIARFQLLYEPTRRILVDEILPSLSEGVRKRAKSIMDERIIPRLE